MEWLIILALAGWVWRQSQRIDVLTRKLDAIEQRVAAPAPPAARAAPSAPEAEDVLVLDTPLPEPSNDDDSADEDVLVLTDALPEQNANVLLLSERMPASPRARRLEQWLTENGLAWLGGGAFAVGGAMLVAIAVQQSWFTPLVRLYCALGLGLGLIGASEWLRRRPNAPHLVAALLAGAGVATFYATIWGAHALYGYIGAGPAAAALTICAALLLALSFRHGQALGVLAIFAAFMAPPLAGADTWAPLSLTLYLGGVAAAGFGVAALQRWAWAGAAALLGSYFWFAAAIGAENVRRALALASFASLGGVALAFRKPASAPPSGYFPWRTAHALAPTIAICVSSIALIWTWLAIAALPNGAVAGPAWVGAMFVALAASAARVRVAPAAVLAVAIGALAIGFASYLAVRYQPPQAQFYPFILFSAGVIIASAINARPHRRDRTLVALAGGAGAALLTALGAFSAEAWHSAQAYAPLCIGAAALLAAAWLQARQVAHPETNAAVDAWICAGAALALLGVESLFAFDIRTAAHAGLALAFATALVWRGWRALAWSALAAAALSIAHALSSDVTGAMLTGAMPLTQGLGVLLLAATFLFAGAYVSARRRQPSHTGEALSSAAGFLVLLGAFLALRWIAAGGAGAPLDAFTENALRALTLMAAGHLALARPGQALGQIGAVRGHLLLALGFVVAALMSGLALNPWWGGQPAIIVGAPFFNTLALAFAAPAALMLFAARRVYPTQRLPGRLYAAAGGALALLWAMLEIRRAFHPLSMAGRETGPIETACYGFVFIAAALTVALLARMRQGQLGADMCAIRRGAAWVGLVLGAWLLAAATQTWWGPGEASGGAFLALILLAAMISALMLGRLLSVSADAEPSRFAAAAAAILFAWLCGHVALRAAPLGGLENALHTLWPLALVLLGSALTLRAPGRETIRPYLYDLQAIWANAAWPAAGAAALGLWLLVNPWWGVWAASAASSVAIALIVLHACAALMTLSATRVPHLRKGDWYAPIARAAAAAHLFVAVTLIVRAAFHDGVLAPGGAEGGELWSYSAVWALFGAGALGYGAVRDDPVLRWCGLALLFATAAKVFAFDTARLSGIIRVASLLGLAAIATLTALGMRRFRARA
jgi:uncharacterized membrane protein